MVDAASITLYTYTSGGQLLTEDGPFASDTVTNTYVQRMRVSLSLYPVRYRVSDRASRPRTVAGHGRTMCIPPLSHGVKQPTGAWTNGFIYDAAGRLTNVTSQAGSFAYLFPSGSATLNASRIGLPNTSYITNTYDPVERLLGTFLKNSGNTTLDSATYVYNLAGQRTQMGRTDSSTVTYTYDRISQLKTALGNGGQSTENLGYDYDTAWNLNYRTNNGSTATFSVNSRDELTSIPGSPCTYDANGNLTQLGNALSIGIVQYTYDDENRLTQVASNYNAAPSGPLIGTNGTNYQSNFTYDGLGRLRKRSESIDGVLQTTTVYIYDGWRVIQERDANNDPLVSYTRGTDLSGSLEGAGGIGGLLARSTGSAGNWTSHAYYHADGNGNVTYLVDSSQGLAASYRYDPFGNTISTNGPLADANVYRFSSKECHVNSGMYYYLYRFYDPNLQRWINRDPLGESAGANLYAFVRNDSVNMYDPEGWYGRGRSSCTFWDNKKNSPNRCTAAYAAAAAIACRLAGESPWERCQRACLQDTYTTFGEDCCSAESTARFIAKTAARYILCAAFCVAVYGPPTRPPLPPL
jgi:RHS repeat-associated protein